MDQLDVCCVDVHNAWNNFDTLAHIPECQNPLCGVQIFHPYMTPCSACMGLLGHYIDRCITCIADAYTMISRLTIQQPIHYSWLVVRYALNLKVKRQQQLLAMSLSTINPSRSISLATCWILKGFVECCISGGYESQELSLRSYGRHPSKNEVLNTEQKVQDTHNY